LQNLLYKIKQKISKRPTSFNSLGWHKEIRYKSTKVGD